MSRHLWMLVATFAVTACGPQAPGANPNTPADGFIGPDMLAGQPYALPVAVPVAQTNAGVSLAVDRAGARAAVAAPAGLFVGPIGGEARKIGDWHGSVRFLRWAPTEDALLVIESEQEPICTETGTGTVCQSSNVDDFARLVKVALADGTRTILAEHVFALGAFELAGEAAVFSGRVGPAPEKKDAAQSSSLYRVDLAGGAQPVAIVANRSLGRFAVSPDGKRLAFTEQVAREEEFDAQVSIQAVGVDQAVVLGRVDRNANHGPFWAAGSGAVRFVGTNNGLVFPVQEFGLDGESRSFTIERPKGQASPVDELFNAPDGAYLLTSGIDRSSRLRPISRLDLDDRTFVPFVPDGRFWHWLGEGPAFLASAGRSWGQRYYIIRPSGSG